MPHGPIRGVDVGDIFADRRALHERGVHRDIRRGICGSGIPGQGAESIVLSRGYEDDVDFGEVIYYTGQGGRDPETGRNVEHQEFTGLNKSLSLNVESRQPVRVVERVTEGFQYRGLFSVDDARLTEGRSGVIICRYDLFSIAGSAPLPATSQQRAAPRKRVTSNRVIRDTAAAGRVKLMHRFSCQFCGERIETPGGPYAEEAHIVPVGGGFDGPDVEGNILCLCPNDHARFDRGAVYVSDRFELIDHERERLGILRLVPEHTIDVRHFADHRRRFGYSRPE